MSLTPSRPQSVSSPTTQEPGHDQTAGAAGDLRQPGMESNAIPSEEEAPEGHWVDHVDELHFVHDRLKALSAAMFAVVFTEEGFHGCANMPIDEVRALSELSSELCTKAQGHVDALYRRLFDYAKEEGNHA